jgi:hypothetical protein
MMRLATVKWGLLVLLVLVSPLGCGGKTKTRPPEDERLPTSAVGEMQMGGSVIRVADPEGKWRFEARSERIEAEGVDGPYRLHPAECRYEEKGRPPVLMRSESARLDKGAKRVLLTGKVRISYETWSLDAERVEYDLKGGKVVASGQTKLTYGEGKLERPSSGSKGQGQ